MSLNDNNWHYYIMLEKGLEKTFDFVEPSCDNYSTFSITYANLIQSVCGEFDSVLKDYCKIISSANKRPSNIQECYQVLKNSNYLNFTNTTVQLFQYNSIQITPFAQWSSLSNYKCLPWWVSYNSIKHDRAAKFKEANLENCLNAFAALYIINIISFRSMHKRTLFPTSNIMSAIEITFARTIRGDNGLELLIDEDELAKTKNMSATDILIS